MKPGRNSVGYLHLGSEYTPDQVEFLRAVDRYKREHRRPYPTWAEVLAVAKSLGYRKQQSGLNL